MIKEKYGLEMASFILENVSVPPEVEQAIDKRSGMAAVGNLNDFVKYQMAQGGVGAERRVLLRRVGQEASAEGQVDAGLRRPDAPLRR